MGDKISQLPAAVSVDGTELVPIVQGGATKSVTGAILRNPTGSAGGDLAGSYPNPTLTAVTTAQSNVGSQSAIPVLTVDAKGRVVALSTVSNPALTTVQIAGLSTAAGAALATAGAVGLSTFAARADHQHARPTAAEVGALGATAAAGGDLAGNFPNPVLASITTAQSNVGSSTVIPIISTDAKGRVTALSSVQFSALTTVQIAGLSTVAPATLATSAVVGLSQFAARADHQHVFPNAAQVGALGATAAASGDLVGNYPNPALATITTAQSNVGSSTVVPVLSIDAKGRVTALGSAPISGSAGGTVTSITAGTGLSGGTITGSGTIDITAVTTAQSNVGSASQIPVLSINAQGQVTALSSVAASGGGAALSTNAPAALATAPFAGLSTEASRSDHQHLFPTAAQVGALGATESASGDLTGNYPGPTLATITTAQSNVGSSTQIPIISIDAKGRVIALSSVAGTGGVVLSTNAPAALSTTPLAGLSTEASRADHVHAIPRIISVSDTSDGIRVTQTGTGSAIRVEDETNPDTSPFVVTNTGNVGVGTDAPTAVNGTVSKVLSLAGANNLVFGFTNTALLRGGILEFNRTGRSPTIPYAQISAYTDNGDGGNLQFFTASTGANNAERLNISATGNVGIGVAIGSATQKLDVAGAVKANLFIDALVTATIATTYTVNVANGSTVSLTLTSATPATITLPTPVTGQSFDVFVKQPASGTPTTVAWSASPSIKWAGGNPPVITAVLGKADLISFKTDGTTWFGSYVQNF
jgi:hypothetical protein